MRLPAPILLRLLNHSSKISTQFIGASPTTHIPRSTRFVIIANIECSKHYILNNFHPSSPTAFSKRNVLTRSKANRITNHSVSRRHKTLLPFIDLADLPPAFAVPSWSTSLSHPRTVALHPPFFPWLYILQQYVARIIIKNSHSRMSCPLFPPSFSNTATTIPAFYPPH